MPLVHDVTQQVASLKAPKNQSSDEAEKQFRCGTKGRGKPKRKVLKFRGFHAKTHFREGTNLVSMKRKLALQQPVMHRVGTHKTKSRAITLRAFEECSP